MSGESLYYINKLLLLILNESKEPFSQSSGISPFRVESLLLYRKDTEHLYHAFVYSLVILLSGIYPFNAMLSLLVTIIYTGQVFGCKKEFSLNYLIKEGNDESNNSQTHVR